MNHHRWVIWWNMFIAWCLVWTVMYTIRGLWILAGLMVLMVSVYTQLLKAEMIRAIEDEER